MIATRHLCVGLLTILVLAGANGQTPQPTTLPAGSATIADLKGDVQIHSPQGESVNAQRGTTLAAESKIDTAKGARTGLFVPERDTLFVAVPHGGSQQAEIRCYQIE